jgi:hypothetical protein
VKSKIRMMIRKKDQIKIKIKIKIKTKRTRLRLRLRLGLNPTHTLKNLAKSLHVRGKDGNLTLVNICEGGGIGIRATLRW